MTVENFRKKKTRALRKEIAAGQPESLSWDDTPWEYDDDAKSHVIEGDEKTLFEVGHVMGISRERVRQLENNVERKLGQLSQLGFDISSFEAETQWAFREIINRWDKERLRKRLAFAERLLVDEELVKRIQDIYGDDLNNEEINFSEFVTVAKSMDRSKAMQSELRLVGTDDSD